MMRRELVKIGDVEFFVELEEASGPTPIVGGNVFSFDHVREAVVAIAVEMDKAWKAVQPDEASVEFGLKLTANQGKLAGLLVGTSGEAALKVKLVWKQP